MIYHTNSNQYKAKTHIHNHAHMATVYKWTPGHI